MNRHNSHDGIILVDPAKEQYTRYLRRLMRQKQIGDELTMHFLREGGFFDQQDLQG